MGSASVSGETVDLWLGTSSAKQSRGIYHSTLNLDNGRLSESRLAAEIQGPGFLTLHPTHDVLYAVGTPIGGAPSVVAYRTDAAEERGNLVLVNAAEIGDGGAAHVAVDKTGQTLLTAQYGGGSVAAFKLASDGSIEKRTQLIEHEGGSGVVSNRQESSHAHWVGFSPDNQFAFVPDLGLDKVVIYRVDAGKAELTPHGAGVVPAGGGPRHMKFHPNGKWIYVLNELSLSVTQFDWDSKAGTMTAKKTIRTVPQEELAREKFKSASEIRVHPNGKFVYSANRGHDTITVFRVDQNSGELSVVAVENIRAATPRNFNLTNDGKWLLAAGQDSNTVGCFEIDQNSGRLIYNGSMIYSPAPICVLFQR